MRRGKEERRDTLLGEEVTFIHGSVHLLIVLIFKHMLSLYHTLHRSNCCSSWPRQLSTERQCPVLLFILTDLLLLLLASCEEEEGEGREGSSTSHHHYKPLLTSLPVNSIIPLLLTFLLSFLLTTL